MNYDITLDGHGYMLAPGTYRRGLDAAGGVGGPPVRQVQREWAGGAGRAIQGERDRFWQSRGLLPVGRGDGPGPGPRETTLTVAGLAPTKRRHGVIAAGRPYMATGGALWRPERGVAGAHPNNLAGLSQLGMTLPQAITGLATDGAERLFLSRAGAGYAVWPLRRRRVRPHRHRPARRLRLVRRLPLGRRPRPGWLATRARDRPQRDRRDRLAARQRPARLRHRA